MDIQQIDKPETTLLQKLFPTRALFLLLFIGFIDLLATALLHSQGLIVELNPLMKPFIERSEWLFAAVKGSSLVAAWAVMVWYAKSNLDFVRKASLAGAAAYTTIWTIWFVAGTALA